MLELTGNLKTTHRGNKATGSNSNVTIRLDNEIFKNQQTTECAGKTQQMFVNLTNTENTTDKFQISNQLKKIWPNMWQINQNQLNHQMMEN